MKVLPMVLMALLIPGHAAVHAQEMDIWLDELSRQLRFSGNDDAWRAAFSGSMDLEFYSFEEDPPGLLRTGDTHLWQPRATLFLDIQAGSSVYGFAQARIDRGFDAANQSLEVRLDEYAIRVTPWKDGRLSLQAGQFATIVGRWTTRHLSWQNPFITAPLLYESPTRISDLQPPRSLYYLTYSSERDGYYYNPVIWGASYATGFAASGKWNTVEWAIELKNASLMSRPEFWSISETNFDAPTVSGRLGWRPDLRWNFGLSASKGSFAGPEGNFPERDEFQQKVFLIDASFEHRHLQVWAELAFSEYSAPGLSDDPQVLSWFIATKYTVLPGLSASLRWNEQRYQPLKSYGQTIGPWGADLQRLDAAVTWRLNAHTQIQVQIDHYWSSDKEMDRQSVIASRLTIRF